MEDAEASYCMYTVLNMGWEPTKFNSLPVNEKAFVIASIDIKIKNENEKLAKLRKA